MRDETAVVCWVLFVPKKLIRIAGATSTAARNVDPMSVKSRRVAILAKCDLMDFAYTININTS